MQISRSCTTVETRVLNQAVTRNIERFPDDFMFQLTDAEAKHLKSQSVTSNWGGRRYLPHAFTEHGILMLGLAPACSIIVPSTSGRNGTGSSVEDSSVFSFRGPGMQGVRTFRAFHAASLDSLSMSE